MIILIMCYKVKLHKYNLLAKVVFRVCQIHVYTDERTSEIKGSYRFGEDMEAEVLFSLETEKAALKTCKIKIEVRFLHIITLLYPNHVSQKRIVCQILNARFGEKSQKEQRI